MDEPMTHKDPSLRMPSRASLVRAAGYLPVLLVMLALVFILKAFVVDAVMIPSHSMEGTLLVGDCVLVNKLVNASSVSDVANAGVASMRLPSIRSIEPGDVVVFKFPDVNEVGSPHDPVWFVKRCVANAGDKVCVSSGRVIVNGVGMSDREETNTMDDMETVVVPYAGESIQLTKENIDRWESLIRGEGHSCENTTAAGILIDGSPATAYTVAQNYLFVLGDNRAHSYDSRSWGFLPQSNVIGKATMIYWSMDRAAPVHDIGDFFSSIRWNRIGKFVQ